MTSPLFSPPTSSPIFTKGPERHQSLLRERALLDHETLKLLSEYISTQHIPEDRHIFSIKRCQVHTIVKRYGKMIGVDIAPIRLGIALPSTLLDPDLIYDGCGSCWGIRT